MAFTRLGLCALAAIALGGAEPPASGGAAPSKNPPAKTSSDAAKEFVDSLTMGSWRVITIHGTPRSVPPGVFPLTPSTFLFGSIEVEVPEDADFTFNERGEIVFVLADDQEPHSFVVRVGKDRIVVGARSRLIVPHPAVGKPRFESIPFAYRVPSPREFLDEADDLGDPADASPYQ